MIPDVKELFEWENRRELTCRPPARPTADACGGMWMWIVNR